MLSGRERVGTSLSSITGQTVRFLHCFLPAVVHCSVSSRERCFEEKGNKVGRLAPPGPATGINSRMEARAAVTPAQQGIHFSPSSQVPARYRCPPICYHMGVMAGLPLMDQ